MQDLVRDYEKLKLRLGVWARVGPGNGEAATRIVDSAVQSSLGCCGLLGYEFD
jgi:hypothetical protein